VALASEASSDRPKPKIFDTRDFIPDAEALLRRGSADAIAEAMRLAALRGIWEGYDRAMRSVNAYGAPPDVEELRNALMDVGMEGKFLPSEERAVPVKKKRPKAIPEIHIAEPVGSLAEVEALAIRTALEATRGNKAEAARKLGIDRGSLYAKLRRLQETEEDPLEAEADAVLRAG
jgi:DNA-binding NtrC family response regulator